MAGYITTSGHCNKLKCYAVYAYYPKNPTTAAYIGKRLLDGSYTLYNAKGKLVYTLKLPLYLDSIGTLFVGAVAGPIAAVSEA